MKATEARERQAPLKEKYRDDPESACVTFSVTGEVVRDELSIQIPTHIGNLVSGLHPAAGGDGTEGCSGDMLLESLVGCAGVTFQAVSHAMGITVNAASITAEGDMDFRGTLGVDRETPVGITSIRLHFDIDCDTDEESITKLISLTERYCVIYQTLAGGLSITTEYANSGSTS